MIAARIKVKNVSGVGAVTNEYGFYSLTLATGNYTFEFSALGYEVQAMDIELNEDKKINIELIIPSKQVEEVIVTSKKKDENVRNAQTGMETLDPKQLSKIPVIFGEKDDSNLLGAVR